MRFSLFYLLIAVNAFAPELNEADLKIAERELVTVNIDTIDLKEFFEHTNEILADYFMVFLENINDMRVLRAILMSDFKIFITNSDPNVVVVGLMSKKEDGKILYLTK